MKTSSYRIGRTAEEFAAKHLLEVGYDILATNWRTRYCEIDIVARRGFTVFFIEVRYRSASFAGSAAQSVTYHKLQRMHTAARFWLANNRWMGDCQLLVLTVDGHRASLIVID